MPTEPPIQSQDGDIVRLTWPGREIILVGTAHVLQESADLATQTILSEKPDSVCVELDAGRLESLRDPERWRKLDLKQVIRKKQVPTLIANLMLSSYQKRMGTNFGSRPGAELLAACDAAASASAQLVLADREIRTTLRRAWAHTSLWRKAHLVAALFESAFDTTPVDAEEIQKLKENDTMRGVLKEFGKAMPELRRVLIDERDLYLARRIADAPGAKVVAVVGAGHREGIAKALAGNASAIPETSSLESIPKSPLWATLLGWGIPILLVLALGYLGWKGGIGAVLDGALLWSLSTGIPAALGVAIAAGHPLVILAALVSAPFTTLIPVVGVGQITILLQAILVPPRVGEIESVTDDIGKFARWWSNRLLRIFLVFIIPGLLTSAGTFLGGWAIFDRMGK